MDLVSLKEYSLWLMPEGKDLDNFKNFFSDIHKKAKITSFESHVTLLGGLSLEESKIVDQINKIAVETAPFKIYFTEVGETGDFYKSIFLKCKETEELMKVNKLAQKLFSTTQSYNPHMSIVYGNIRPHTKKEILNSINPLIIKSLFFKVVSIYLCKAFGTYDQWKIVHKIPLNKR